VFFISLVSYFSRELMAILLQIWEPSLQHLLLDPSVPRIDEIWAWEATQHGDSALINHANLSGICGPAIDLFGLSDAYNHHRRLDGQLSRYPEFPHKLFTFYHHVVSSAGTFTPIAGG
jgi:hypothetical protein